MTIASKQCPLLNITYPLPIIILIAQGIYLCLDVVSFLYGNI